MGYGGAFDIQRCPADAVMTARWSRRATVGSLATLMPLARQAQAQFDELPTTRARFLEAQGNVWMTVYLPSLFPAADQIGRAQLDSGFPTTIVIFWQLYLRESAGLQLVARSGAKLVTYFDPWANHYVLEQRSSIAATQQIFSTSAELVAALTSPKVFLVPSSTLIRGKARYVVRVLAMRNPNQEASSSIEGASQAILSREGGFIRWLRLFMRERPLAESIVDAQTGEFYLR